jgi:hypothetical protein
MADVQKAEAASGHALDAQHSRVLEYVNQLPGKYEIRKGELSIGFEDPDHLADHLFPFSRLPPVIISCSTGERDSSYRGAIERVPRLSTPDCDHIACDAMTPPLLREGRGPQQ